MRGSLCLSDSPRDEQPSANIPFVPQNPRGSATATALSSAVEAYRRKCSLISEAQTPGPPENIALLVCVISIHLCTRKPHTHIHTHHKPHVYYMYTTHASYMYTLHIHPANTTNNIPNTHTHTHSGIDYLLIFYSSDVNMTRYPWL